MCLWKDISNAAIWMISKKIDYHLANPISPDEKSIFRSRIEETYNWKKIADQTIKIYEKALAK